MNRLVKFSLTACLAILGIAAMPVLADHELIMTTMEFDVPGKAAVLRGDYTEAIEDSEDYVDANWYARRLAARTNLCISYAGLGDFENAVKWCDAAMEISSATKISPDTNKATLQNDGALGNRVSWIARNNRAVLHLLMGEAGEGHAMLEAAEDKLRGKLYQVVARNNHEEAEYREATAQTSADRDSLVVKSAN